MITIGVQVAFDYDHPAVTSAALIGAAFATAQSNSLLRNLPPPIFFSIISQTIADARDQSSSDRIERRRDRCQQIAAIANGHEDGEMQASVAHGHADVVDDLVERVSDDFSLFFNADVVVGIHDAVLQIVEIFISCGPTANSILPCNTEMDDTDFRQVFAFFGGPRRCVRPFIGGRGAEKRLI